MALTLFALLFATAARADPAVELDAQVDQEVVAVNQTVTLTVTVTVHGNSDVQKLQLPSSPQLRELGRSQSQQSSFSLGSQGMDVSRSTTYRISLQPQRIGDVTLPPAVAVVGGQTYKSPAAHVKIVAAGQAPAPARRRPQAQNPFGSIFGLPDPFQGQGPNDNGGEDPFQDLFGGGRPPSGSDVFLAAGVDRRQAFLGQQITYSVRLYTRVDEFDGLKLPGFDGFWGEDLETPTHPMPSVQNVGGVPYQVYLVKKKALFPSRAGTLTIGPAEVDVGAGGLFFRGHKLHRATDSIAISVQPLPAGAPPGFTTSNVGEWSLGASLRPTSVPAGEPATLTLTVQGTGNLHAVTLPALPAIPGLRAYDPTSSDKTGVNGDHFGGSRKVEIVLIGQRTGDFVIPPLDFAIFDPAAHTYRTQQTPALHLMVTAGANAAGAAGGAQNVLEASFRPLRTSPAWTASRLPALRGRPLWVAFGAPPFVFGLLYAAEEWRRRRTQAAPALRMRHAYRVARRRIKAARVHLEGGASDKALADLTSALHGYLEDRAGASLAGLSHAELGERLRALGATAEAATAAVTALESCEASRYSPGARGAEAGGALLSRIEWAVDALERCEWKTPRRAA